MVFGVHKHEQVFDDGGSVRLVSVSIHCDLDKTSSSQRQLPKSRKINWIIIKSLQALNALTIVGIK